MVGKNICFFGLFAYDRIESMGKLFPSISYKTRKYGRKMKILEKENRIQEQMECISRRTTTIEIAGKSPPLGLRYFQFIPTTEILNACQENRTSTNMYYQVYIGMYVSELK